MRRARQRRSPPSGPICRRLFGNRLIAVVAYGLDNRRRAIAHARAGRSRDVRRPRGSSRAATRLAAVAAWRCRSSCRGTSSATLDVFPLEYGDIIAITSCSSGRIRFVGVEVGGPIAARGCELQAKSHLIHLREGFLETQGDPRAVAR